MYCPQCGHQTDGGNFCEKCGSPLSGQSGHQHAAQTGTAAKQAAKQFGSFVLSVLKRPYQECKATGGEQLISAIITMVLFSLLTPLMSCSSVTSPLAELSLPLFFEPAQAEVYVSGLSFLIFFIFVPADWNVDSASSKIHFFCFLSYERRYS